MVLEHSSWRRKLDTHPAANCLINVPALHQNKSSNFLLKTLLTPKASGGHTLTQCLLLSLLCLPKREGVQTLCASFCRNYFLNQSAQPLHVLALQFTLHCSGSVLTGTPAARLYACSFRNGSDPEKLLRLQAERVSGSIFNIYESMLTQVLSKNNMPWCTLILTNFK